MIRAVETPAALGHAFNIANARPLTQKPSWDRGLLRGLAARQIQLPPACPRERILRAGGHPMGPRLYFGMYFDLPPVTMVVISKAQRVLRFKPTPFIDGLRQRPTAGTSATTRGSRIDYSFGALPGAAAAPSWAS